MLTSKHRALPAFFVCCLCALLGACATPALDHPAGSPEFSGLPSRTVDGVTVKVAALTDTQARREFGVDLGDQDVQALWIQVRNASDRTLWFIRNMLDPDFYSADEVALMFRHAAPDADFDTLRQQLRDASIRVQIRPRTQTQGHVFIPKKEGGRFLNVSLQGDAWDEGERASVRPRELRFGFVVAMPDGEFDYESFNSTSLYPDQALPDLTPEQLRAALEALPCCTTNAAGVEHGDPLNIVLVGSAHDVMHSLARGGWSFTHRITLHTIVREVRAALFGAPYAVAPVSTLYALGRGHDVALQRARRSIAQRNHLRLWLAPFHFEGRPVWIGQISRDIGVKLTTKSPTFTTHVIDPEVDTTREYLLHSLMAERVVDRFGFVKGAAEASRDHPRTNLTDDPYFSDGLRLVVVLANEPVAVHKTRNLMWERSAAPVAEGQSPSSNRNTESIEMTRQ